MREARKYAVEWHACRGEVLLELERPVRAPARQRGSGGDQRVGVVAPRGGEQRDGEAHAT